MAFTGYELANYGTNEGTDAGGEDFNNIIIIFCFWTALKLGYVPLYERIYFSLEFLTSNYMLIKSLSFSNLPKNQHLGIPLQNAQDRQGKYNTYM